MRDDIAEIIQLVIRTGFDLKERRERGEPVDVEEARSALLALLNDPRLSEPSRDERGARFALVCWLDEIMIDSSDWGQKWSERSLERQLYETRERAHLFWDPGVRRAESRPGSDALEVYYLCFLLGFRGDYDNRPEDLRAWADRLRPQVIRGYGNEPPQLDKSTPESNVPLLQGREHFQTMIKTWVGVLLLLAFALGFLLIYKIWGRG